MNQLIDIQENQQVGQYYFKVVRTTNTQSYLLPVNISIQEFFRVVTINIMDDFGYTTSSDFELVLAGQQVDGIHHAEDVPSIYISSLIGTLYDNYRNYAAFYIRPTAIINSPIALEDPAILSTISNE